MILCLDLCFFSSLAFDVQLNVLNHVLEKEAEFKVCNLTDSGELNVINLVLAAKASDGVLDKLKDQDSKIKRLEELNRKLVLQIDRVEQETKVNNVIFSNIEESKLESPKLSMKKVLHTLNQHMRVRTRPGDISIALRMESSSNATEVRPIVVRFNSFEHKMRVLEGEKKLRNSKIKISADYSELVKRRRDELLPFLLEKRALGHDTFIYYDKLMVDGVKFSLEDLQAEKRGRGKSDLDPTTSTSITDKDPTTEEKDGEKQKREPSIDWRVEVPATTQDPTTEMSTQDQGVQVSMSTQENFDFEYQDYEY